VGSWAWVFGPYAQRPVPLREVAQLGRAMGYEGLELTGKPHAHPDLQTTGAKRRELTRQLADEGLAVASLGGPVGGGSPLVVERAAYLESIASYVEFGVDAGIGALRVSSGRPESPAEDQRQQERAFERLADYWRAAADLAAQAGIRLLWEFEPNQFASRPHDVLRVVDAVDRPHFQVMFDLSHAYVVSVAGKGLPMPGAPLAGGLEAFARLLGSRVGRLHVADTAGETMANGGSQRCHLGQGAVTFEPVLRALQIGGGGMIGDGWWTLDLHGESDATLVARQSKDFMDRLADRMATHA